MDLPVTLDTRFVPPDPALRFFGKFTAFLLLAMCALGGVLSIAGSGVRSGDVGADGTRNAGGQCCARVAGAGRPLPQRPCSFWCIEGTRLTVLVSQRQQLPAVVRPRHTAVPATSPQFATALASRSARTLKLFFSLL